MSKPEFPCPRCGERDHCKVDLLYVDCSALDAYKKKMRLNRFGSR